MFYKVLIVFFVILILLFGCLIFTVHDRQHRPVICGKLADKWTCEKETDCPQLDELVNDFEIHHCGNDEQEAKVCCPAQAPVDPKQDEVEEKIPEFQTKHLHPKSTAIVNQKCREYAELTLINQTVDSRLPDGEEPIRHQIRECVEIESLIVGAVNASEEEFPHMALIGFGETIDDAEYPCEGTLISDQFILTAAHCTPTAKNIGSWALLGSVSKLDAISDNENKNVFQIVELINHPEYDEVKKRHDIALYKLENPVEFTPYIRPVCLATSSLGMTANSTVDEDTKGLITGWGSNGQGFSLSDYLLKTSVRILDDDVCKTDPLFSSNFDSDNMICAGSLDTSTDSCWGDSGGPLQIPIPETDCMWNQIGVTSHGHVECGGRPTIYTKVAFYVPWIQSVVWPES